MSTTLLITCLLLAFMTGGTFGALAMAAAAAGGQADRQAELEKYRRDDGEELANIVDERV